MDRVGVEVTEMDVTLLTDEDQLAREFAFLEMRFRRAMQDAPGVVGFVLASRLKFAAGGQSVPVSGTREPPLPFRESAVDDADAAYALLVQWVVVWAELLGEVAPSAVQVAWRRELVSGGLVVDGERIPDTGGVPTGEDEPVGFPAGTTPEGATGLVRLLTSWLLQRHPRIVVAGPAVEYMTELTDVLGRIARAHRTVVDRRQGHAQRSRVCPICGDDAVLVSWYSADTSDLIVQCHGCNANTAELLKVLGIPGREYARFLGWLETGQVPDVVEPVPFDASNAAHVALARRVGRLDLIGGQ